MRYEPFGTIIVEHRLNGILSGVAFPMIAHTEGWKCQNPRCEHFEQAAR
jgi:hypothetical protein